MIRAYKLWHGFLPHIPKDARYTVGAKVDSAFIETVEAVFRASITAKDKKIAYIEEASIKLDIVKFFLQIIWEIKALDTKKYALISAELNEIGRMIGGWLRQAMSRN